MPLYKLNPPLSFYRNLSASNPNAIYLLTPNPISKIFNLYCIDIEFDSTVNKSGSELKHTGKTLQYSLFADDVLVVILLNWRELIFLVDSAISYVTMPKCC